MDSIVQFLNANKIVWGVTMLVVNLGSRHIISDLGQMQEQILRSAWFKPIIVFSIFFMATRDVWTAMILTAAFLIIFMGLLHEKSKYSFFANDTRTQKQNQKGRVSVEEYTKAMSVVKQFEHQEKEELTKYYQENYANPNYVKP